MDNASADTTAYQRLRTLVLAVADGRPLSHRWLAAQIGCSASRIPLFLHRMELAGEIRREPFKNTHTIYPLNIQGCDEDTPPERSGGGAERSPLNVQPDRSGSTPDRSGVNVQPTPDRSPLIDQGVSAMYGSHEVLSSNLASSSSSSSNAGARESEPTWADVHAALECELKRVPLRDFQQRGLSPGFVLAEWAVTLTRPDLAPPSRGKVFVKALLNGERIYGADDIAAREDSNAPPERPARAGRPAAADQQHRPANRRPPTEPIDAAALAAKFKPPSRDGW